MPIFNEQLALQEVEEFLYGDGELSEELGAEIKSLARAIVLHEFGWRSDVDDIIAECTFAALNAVVFKYDPDRSSRLHSYLSRVISNKAIDICRRRQAELVGDDILLLNSSTQYSDTEAHERYADMGDECVELMICRYRLHDTDDVADVFDIVYELEIPECLRGGRRGAVAQIQRMTKLPRTEASNMYMSVHFLLRLGILDMLDKARIEEYTRPKTENILTLVPEFAVAYSVNDLALAMRLLHGMILKL